jgi:hypothetical protein
MKSLSHILQLHPRLSKSASEQAAARHIVARQREHQALAALTCFGATPLVLPQVGLAGASLASGECATPTAQLQQLEAYVQHRVALAIRERGVSG